MTTCIVTTEANSLMAPLHDRMPVIVPREAHSAWLDPETPGDELRGLLRPYPSEAMEMYEVDPKYVNSPRNDGPECIEPVGADQ
ncbi:MAG: yedK [Gemmataceae bacterium]|nr:yedK [Gemmataceae bacterium]